MMFAELGAADYVGRRDAGRYAQRRALVRRPILVAAVHALAGTVFSWAPGFGAQVAGGSVHGDALVADVGQYRLTAGAARANLFRGEFEGAGFVTGPCSYMVHEGGQLLLPAVVVCGNPVRTHHEQIDIAVGSHIAARRRPEYGHVLRYHRPAPHLGSDTTEQLTPELGECLDVRCCQVRPVERVSVGRSHPLPADDALFAQPVQRVANPPLGVAAGHLVNPAAGEGCGRSRKNRQHIGVHRGGDDVQWSAEVHR